MEQRSAQRDGRPSPHIRRARRAAALLTGLITLAFTVLAGGVVSAGAAQAAVPARAASSPVLDFGCAHPAHAGQARCFGMMRAHRTSSGLLAPLATGSPTTAGYVPSDLRSAYNLGGTSGGGRTVAIVDAYDDPSAEADLGKYRSAYGLSACTTASGCFHKVNQNGQASPLPSADAGWAEEISLDLDMVSATCPDCHIQLVEANSANTSDLMKAEDQAAATSGVVSISNSWGGAEDSTITSDDSHFNHPGIAATASSGDSGYGVSWPASSPYVTAVGGTSLTKASNSRGWSETAWGSVTSTSGAGSGCSAYEAKPSWQHDTGCAKRTVADVSAVADPNTGVAVYDTYNTCGTSSYCDLLISLGAVAGADGWVQVGGTSASSPIIASVYALAGNTASPTAGSYPYSHTSALNDVTSGSNGACGNYLCTAGTGYDGPTGLGTPNGTGAF
ncbi:S53 family peptidase [Streptomyces mirabilis]|uniref:S53 family peptidase n=1 Tax=Streptomyces mirabilis TaxID=68239 RepID=UPI002259D4F4|nr:S53 family peptidase [Streptomyces mirabilis]MCX4427082.1 S53 family peptidase [Streptomyces mirabilis]